MNKKGFTLIELMVVIVIICILAGLTLSGSFGARKVARDGRRKADLEQIRSALEIYRSDCKTYPATITFGGSLQGTTALGCNNTYMDKIPNDPLSGRTYVYALISPNSYVLCSYLETDQKTIYDGTCGFAGVCGNHCYYKVTNY